ncbi:uncharacterized protein METZ01_LOCUS295943 [marine metagenome]|uniref:Uncharacterized protein n=1 Tax=marine metagenome TaxID=408172 RepID=A0A382M2B5_9ZZZZ
MQFILLQMDSETISQDAIKFKFLRINVSRQTFCFRSGGGFN